MVTLVEPKENIKHFMYIVLHGELLHHEGLCAQQNTDPNVSILAKDSGILETKEMNFFYKN